MLKQRLKKKKKEEFLTQQTGREIGGDRGGKKDCACVRACLCLCLCVFMCLCVTWVAGEEFRRINSPGREIGVVSAVFQPWPQKLPSTFLQDEECS